MKKLSCLGSLAALILAAQGCNMNNIEPDDNTTTWVLNVDSQTRTSLQGRDILWENGDTVCCIATYEDDRLDGGRYSLYYNIRPEEMNGNSAVIKVTSGGGYNPKYVIYPSSDAVRYYAEGLLEIPVPGSHIMRAGDIPKGSNISVGSVEGDNVFMRNIMTMMKFEVDYPENMNIEVDGIKQIIVSSNGGEAISGKLIYDPTENLTVSTSGSSKLYLYPPDDEPYFPEGVYCFPVPSITLSKGLKVKISRMDDFVAPKSYDTPVSLAKNSIVNMGKTTEWGLTYENTMRVIKASISTLDKVLYNNGWPFVEKDPGAGGVCGKGLVGPFHLPDNEDADFWFYVASKTGSDSWRVTGGAGRRFGGTPHDYMLLPAVDGYRLISVFIQAGTQKSTYAITDNPSSGTPTVIDGGEVKDIDAKQNHTFSLSNTQPGVAYRLDLPTATPSGIIEFKLTYEKE